MQATSRTDATPASDSATEPTMEQVPDDLNSPRAKLVYLYLATHGAVTEDELCDGLGMKRISLYSILKTLRGADHVTKDGDRYVLN
ncbi:TrmB family transcriptional regulator [Halobaculum sp. D14]|uniref:TrmB family transcriptional regulator n=1 Tax=unclassified Halobaculum TaxID=2640896 RepID=UPI003EC0C001